jgi:NADPH:quinone reductase-like Zn-dependent oxidoreductase
MRAYILDKCTKKSALRPGDDLERTIGDDDALVEIHAAGLNQLDSKIRDGEFKLTLPYRPPFVLGHGVTGVSYSSCAPLSGRSVRFSRFQPSSKQER